MVQDIDLDYCDIERFALEIKRDHSVAFEIASKHCISDSFVDHDGYSLSSKGFLPTEVDISSVQFSHSVVSYSLRPHESRQIGSGQQEMARVNADILGISELKWTGIGEFNSDDH